MSVYPKTAPLQKEVKRFRKKVWKLFKEQTNFEPFCFDCTKPLPDPEDADAVMMVDCSHFLFLCSHDYYRREDLKSFWRRVFKN